MKLDFSNCKTKEDVEKVFKESGFEKTIVCINKNMASINKKKKKKFKAERGVWKCSNPNCGRIEEWTMEKHWVHDKGVDYIPCHGEWIAHVPKSDYDELLEAAKKIWAIVSKDTNPTEQQWIEFAKVIARAEAK